MSDDLRQPRTEAGQGLLETLDTTDGSALAQILAIEEQAALAARSEPRSCDPREHGGKHAPWCHAARSEPRAYEPLSGLDALRHDIEAEPRAHQNPDVPWRDETLYYPDRSEPRAEGLREAREAAQQWSAAVKRHDEDAMSHWAAEMCTYITVAAIPPAEGLDVERLARAFSQGYRAGLANEVDDWNASDEAIDEYGRKYAALVPEQPE